MRNFISAFCFSLLFSSCFNIKSDKTVEKDAVEYLKSKYNQDFTFVSVYNTTIGHGKGAIMATGNEFSVNFQTNDSFPMAFNVICKYDTAGVFIARDDYKENILLVQAVKEFNVVFKKHFPENPGNVYVSCFCDSILDDIEVKDIEFKKTFLQYPYTASMDGGDIYVFRKFAESEKEINARVKKFLKEINSYKLNDVEVFIYYWDENLIKGQNMDSLNFCFCYDSHNEYWEGGKEFEKRFELKLYRNELEHLDTLLLTNYMREY